MILVQTVTSISLAVKPLGVRVINCDKWLVRLIYVVSSASEVCPVIRTGSLSHTDHSVSSVYVSSVDQSRTTPLHFTFYSENNHKQPPPTHTYTKILLHNLNH